MLYDNLKPTHGFTGKKNKIHVHSEFEKSLFSHYLSLQASIRLSSSYLIGYFFQNSKLYIVDEAPNMISTLIILLSDTDPATVEVMLGVVLFTFQLHVPCSYCHNYRWLGKLYRGL